MISHPKELESQDVSQLSREALIARLLDFNQSSTFQFTPAWLNKQWKYRLRSLLRAAQQQSEAQERSPN